MLNNSEENAYALRINALVKHLHQSKSSEASSFLGGVAFTKKSHLTSSENINGFKSGWIQISHQPANERANIFVYVHKISKRKFAFRMLP